MLNKIKVSWWFCLLLVSLLYACATAYQPNSFTGGYTDYALGGGKYKVLVKGNGYTTSSRARNIAYLRAAEISEEHGKPYFYVLEDNLQVTSDHVNLQHGAGVNIHKSIYQLTIQPTDSTDGLNVRETKFKCKSALEIEKSVTTPSNLAKQDQKMKEVEEVGQYQDSIKVKTEPNANHPNGIR